MSPRAVIQPNNNGSSVGDFVERVQVVDGNGNIVGGGGSVTTATLANVASSASSVTLFASNAAARLRTVFNDSTSVVFIKFNSGAASNSSYTVQVPANGYYEFPQPLYTGAVTAIWTTANGNARTMEA